MDGVAAVRVALVAHGALTALVPATKITAGALPQDIVLPALSIERISRTDRNIPGPGANRFVSERVQVTIHAKTYVSQEAILDKVRDAAADKFPTVSGLINVTIHTDGTGPPFMNEEASIYLATQDFRVTYSEAR